MYQHKVNSIVKQCIIRFIFNTVFAILASYAIVLEEFIISQHHTNNKFKWMELKGGKESWKEYLPLGVLSRSLSSYTIYTACPFK